MAKVHREAAQSEDAFVNDFYNRYLEVEMSDGGSGRVKFFVLIKDILETEGQAFVQEFEKSIILGVIDNRWKDHLRAMDELKQNVQTARFEQKDPLMIYKREAFDLFMANVETINRETLSLLFKSNVVGEQEASEGVNARQRSDDSRLQAKHSDTPTNTRKKKSRVAMPAGGGGGQQERQLSRRERREMERKEKKRKKKR